MKKVRVIGPKDKEPLPKDSILIYTISRTNTWGKAFSPFYLGPCKLYGNFISKNVENAWQYSKVYRCHVDDKGNPNKRYFEWAKSGWESNWAKRYPIRKGAKPLYSLWDGNKLSYVNARKKIYVPLYFKAVKETPAYQRLKDLYETSEKEIYLWDFDGYNNEKLGMSLKDVLNNPNRSMGHAFVLASMLEKGK